MAADPVGNVYVADAGNHRIRRIDRTGVITTIAGTGEAGYSGDGGPAGAARLRNPTGIAIDAAGHLYVADRENSRVRRIDPTGVITTFAGPDGASYSEGVGPAGAAQLRMPAGVATDTAGNVYVADTWNEAVGVVGAEQFKATVQLGSSDDLIELPVSRQGRVMVHGRPAFSGTNVASCDGNVYALHLALNGGLRASYVSERQVVPLEDSRPITLVRDESDVWRIGDQIVGIGHQHVQGGREYFLDVAGGRWRIASHVLKTVAGDSGVKDGIPATASTLHFPNAVAADTAGNVLIADTGNHRIRRIDPTGRIETLAGNGEPGFSGDGGPATAAQMDAPQGVETDAFGNVYVADTGNHRIRRIDPTGRIETLAGNGEPGFSGDGGPATAAQMDAPQGVETDAFGNVYVADTGNRRVRRIDPTGRIESLQGLDNPSDVAIDAAGFVYVALGRRHTLVRYRPEGRREALAGTSGKPGFSGDGGRSHSTAQFDSPQGIAVDAAGNIYVADTMNHRVRRVEQTGTRLISTFAGNGEQGYSGDGGLAVAAQLNHPVGVAIDAAGNIYVADSGNHRVRRIDPAGNISTVAGTGAPFDLKDGGPASEAGFSLALGSVATDAVGNVYVADSGNHRVRRIDPAGMIATVAGTGDAGFGDDGLAATVQLDTPTGVAVGSVGEVYIADSGNHRVLRVDNTGMLTTFAGTGEAGYSGEHHPAASSQLKRPTKVTADTGNVYILDAGNGRVRVVSPSGQIRTIAGNGKLENPSVLGLLSRFFTGFDATRVSLFGASDLAVGPIRAGETALRLGTGTGAPLGLSLVWTVRLADSRISPAPYHFEDKSGVPVYLAASRDGTVYLADGAAIRALDRNGAVSTVAELGPYGISVGGMSVDQSGRIWFSDPKHRRVRMLEPVH